jgi:hypothetical protein
MALYEHKEFLSFDDVAEYLTGKNIHNFELNFEEDFIRLIDFLSGLLFEKKINAVFKHISFASQLVNKKFIRKDVQGKKICPFIYALKEPYNPPYNLQGDIYGLPFQNLKEGESEFEFEVVPVEIIKPYFIANEIIINSVFSNEKIFRHEPSINFYQNMLFKPYSNQNDRVSFVESFVLTLSDLLYPKVELDELFNQQPQTDNTELVKQLQAKNAALLERITQLEQAGKAQQPSDTPATGEPLKGIAKVNYDKDRAKAFANIVAKFLWGMDTTQQIKSGDMANQIYALLVEFDNGATPETVGRIKDWLAEIAPTYAKQSGRPPKDQPTEIPLTLKK